MKILLVKALETLTIFNCFYQYTILWKSVALVYQKSSKEKMKYLGIYSSISYLDPSNLLQIFRSTKNPVSNQLPFHLPSLLPHTQTHIRTFVSLIITRPDRNMKSSVITCWREGGALSQARDWGLWPLSLLGPAFGAVVCACVQYRLYYTICLRSTRTLVSVSDCAPLALKKKRRKRLFYQKFLY